LLSIVTVIAAMGAKGCDQFARVASLTLKFAKGEPLARRREA